MTGLGSPQYSRTAVIRATFAVSPNCGTTAFCFVAARSGKLASPLAKLQVTVVANRSTLSHGAWHLRLG